MLTDLKSIWKPQLEAHEAEYQGESQVCEMAPAILSNLCPDRRDWDAVLRDLHQGDTGDRRLDRSSTSMVVRYPSKLSY